MCKIFHNLFPPDLDQIAEQTFGPRYCKPVLLKLLELGCNHDAGDENLTVLSLLNPKEIVVFNRYKLAKRRAEFITGRICAKIVTRNYLSPEHKTPAPATLREIEISSGTTGRPFVRNPNLSEHPSPEISIAHSRDFAVATASQFHCGIDIQKSDETLSRVKKKYCTIDEYQLLQKLLPKEEQLTRLTILWAAKEAVKKACSHHWMPGFLDIELIQLDKSSPTCSILAMTVTNRDRQHRAETHTVVTGMFKQYGVALCIGEDHDNA